MIKLIEDVLFEDDNTNIIKAIHITSKKSTSDKVIINVNYAN